MSEEKRLTRRRVLGTAAAAGGVGVAGALLGIPLTAGAATIGAEPDGGGGAPREGGAQRPAFVLHLEIEGREDAGGFFTEVSGLGSETEVVEVRSGGEDSDAVRKIPGRTRVGDITLKRGITEGTGLWDWRRTVIEGSVERRAGTLTLLNTQAEAVSRWHFENAWPSKLYAASPPADTRAAALIEELTIVVDALDREF